MTPELYRPIAVERVGPGGLDVEVEASPPECAAVALRMGLPAVLALSCHFRLTPDTADAILAHGHLVARVVQTCVVSLEDFATTVDERFILRCVPEGQESENDDPEAPDEIVYIAGMLDLGEAAAEQLALALDPYPRAPGAELPDIGDVADEGVFAALGALKRPN